VLRQRQNHGHATAPPDDVRSLTSPGHKYSGYRRGGYCKFTVPLIPGLSVAYRTRRARLRLYWYYNGLHLPARRYVSAILAIALCLSVSHKSVFCRNGWTDRAGFWRGSFLRPVLHCVVRKLRYLQKYRVLSATLLQKNSGLRKFHQNIPIVEACHQLHSRKVQDSQSVINWTVVGQLR